MSGENDTKAVDSVFFFFHLRPLGYSNSEYPLFFTSERPETLSRKLREKKIILALRYLAA